MLIIGPQPDPITGVSLANKVVYEVLLEEGFHVDKINTSFSNFDDQLGHFSFSKLWFNLKYNLQAYKIFKNQTIYITPGQTFFGILKYSLFIGLGSLSRKRMIIHIHGNHLRAAYDDMYGIKKWIVRKLLNNFSKGIVLSLSLTSNLSPFLRESDIFILPNFAQDYLYSNLTKDYKEPRFIYLSNLIEEKGILDLLKAFRMMEEREVFYTAQIAGAVSKEMWTSIRPMLNSLQNVSYLGVIDGEKKKAMLAWGNVFVLPTYYAMEGQPISILEAMATGNLILTTSHGGIPDIIEDAKHGFFIEKRNPHQIAQKMMELVENPQIISDIGRSNQLCFRENFTVEHFKSRLLKILAST